MKTLTDIRCHGEHQRTNNPNVGPPPVDVKATLPFYYTIRATKAHRVRAAVIFYRWTDDTKTVHALSHVAVKLWCGQAGFLHPTDSSLRYGRLYETLPDGVKLCATCEGRAVGAGQVEPCCERAANLLYRNGKVSQ